MIEFVIKQSKYKIGMFGRKKHINTEIDIESTIQELQEVVLKHFIFYIINIIKKYTGFVCECYAIRN
jgi:hypothetical protein